VNVRKRLRRGKRKSFGSHQGNEVTSGFDRHRFADTDSETDEDNPSPKRATRRPSTDNTLELKLKELEKKLEQEKAIREEAEKNTKTEREKNSKLTNEMKECIKTFYPTSWKKRNEYAHKKIDSWDYAQINKITDDWKKSYGDDLKKVVESTKQKKALKAKIEVAEKLQQKLRDDPQKMEQHIKTIIKEAKLQLEKVEAKK